MHVDDNTTPSLSPDAARWVERFLQQAKKPEEAPALTTDVPLLVRYLAGVTDRETQHRMERWLVTDPALRRHLDSVDICLEEIKRLAWSAVLQQRHEEGIRGEVARAWQEVATERTENLGKAPDWWLSRGWDATCERLNQGVAEAEAAWVALWAFGSQLTATLGQPQLALARGESPAGATITGALPEQVTLTVTEAEVCLDGALHVALQAHNALDQSPAFLDGIPVSLAIKSDQSSWPIASGVFHKGSAEWRLGALGEMLGLPKGPFPAHYLHITCGDSKPVAIMFPYLWAEVVHAADLTPVAAPRVVEISEPPLWKDGQIHVSLSISRVTRLTYPDHSIQLSLILSPQHEQLLGIWPIREWTDAPRRLIVDAPGQSPTGSLPTANLRIRLVSPA